MRCPHCRSEDFARSRMRPRDWLLLPLLLRPFRCLSCHRRFHRPAWLRPPGVYRGRDDKSARPG